MMLYNSSPQSFTIPSTHVIAKGEEELIIGNYSNIVCTHPRIQFSVDRSFKDLNIQGLEFPQTDFFYPRLSFLNIHVALFLGFFFFHEYCILSLIP